MRTRGDPKLTPAYTAVRDARVAFLSMIKTWVRVRNLKRGPYKNNMIDLQAAFAEWVEAQQPGQGEIFRQIVTPQRWLIAFKKAMPLVKSAGDGRSNRCWLNCIVEVKKPMLGIRYGICDRCRQSCMINAITREPSVSAEALTEALVKLKQEAIEAVGPEMAGLPVTAKRPLPPKME